MRLAVLLVLLALSACASRMPAPEVQVNNPWQANAESLARSGVDAMEREKWGFARVMFERSLQAATLAGDEKLMALGHYNLGRAQTAGGDAAAARQSYRQAIRQADSAGDAVNARRAALALAMLEDGDAQASEAQLDVPVAFPIDIHLAAARLAVLRGRENAARQSYARVLGMAGKDRNGLLYAARAHLGMAELEYAADSQGGNAAAWAHLNTSLGLLRRAGQPRLMLQAVKLAAKLESEPVRRQMWQQRARALENILQRSAAR